MNMYKATTAPTKHVVCMDILVGHVTAGWADFIYYYPNRNTVCFTHWRMHVYRYVSFGIISNALALFVIDLVMIN
jgi:hypothetical protein